MLDLILSNLQFDSSIHSSNYGVYFFRFELVDPEPLETFVLFPWLTTLLCFNVMKLRSLAYLTSFSLVLVF